MELTERYACETDFGWLWNAYRGLLKSSIDAQWGWNEKFQERFFRSEFPVGEFAIHSWAGVDVGASLVKSESDHFYVKMLLVLPEFQGAGIGRSIIERLQVKAARDQKTVRLSVIKANDVDGFYEKLGFNRIGEDDGSTRYQYSP